MSGSGPFGPIFHGVWQSLQPPNETRYSPRTTRAAPGGRPSGVDAPSVVARASVVENQRERQNRNGIARRP